MYREHIHRMEAPHFFSLVDLSCLICLSAKLNPIAKHLPFLSCSVNLWDESKINGTVVVNTILMQDVYACEGIENLELYIVFFLYIAVVQSLRPINQTIIYLSNKSQVN